MLSFTNKVQCLVAIAVAQVAAMTLWFSAAAGASALLAQGQLSGRQAAFLTSAVQLGFVGGTLSSAAFGLADRWDPRRVFCLASLAGAALNLLLLSTGFDNWMSVLLRFGTGIALAGVYPVGIKLAAGWAGSAVGLIMGVLVGALTVGSALPHLFHAFYKVDWQMVIILSSLCVSVAAGLILSTTLGPTHVTVGSFRLREAWRQSTQPAIL